MYEAAFMETVSEICREDPRYRPDAYLFVREALDFTTKALKKPNRGPDKHVSGQELLEGIRRYALQEYGPMALTVLHTWGITRTDDFGEIVFNLVESGKLGKTDEDRREDFCGGYDFRAAFEFPFLPRSDRQRAGRSSRAESRESNDE
jgi:uncharacterized repeat protein (TIGR04138 family)